MFQSFGQRLGGLIAYAPTRRGAGHALVLVEADALAVARQLRANYLIALIRALVNHCRTRVSLLQGAVVLASLILAIAFAVSLSLGGRSTTAAAMLAILVAATFSSIAGFAFSAICGVMLVHIMSDPVQVVVVMMVCSIAIQSLSVSVLWRAIDWRALSGFLVGGVAGLPIGVWLLLHLGNLWFKEMVGGLLTAYAAYALFRRPLTIKQGNRFVDICVGFVGGITGGFAGFPGAAVTIWCGMKGWDKTRQRGVYQPFILIMQVLGLAFIQLMRSSATSGADFGVLQFIPAALLGTWFGLGVFKRLSDRGFTLTVNVLLLVSGIGLLV
jgi:uncharacterized membrane protein YfcA